MSSSIVIITPYDELSKKVEQIVKSLNEDIDVFTGLMEEAVLKCKELERDGAKVFVSRGGNTEFIAERIDAPIVDIVHGVGDYMEALERAKGVVGTIGVFSFNRKIGYLETVAKLIDVEIKQYIFTSNEDAKRAVMNALDDGIVMGIGGVITQKLCELEGLKYVRVDSSRESIVNAIKNAKEVFCVQKEEQEKSDAYRIQMENYKAVVNFSYNGVIGLDMDYKINVFNESAEKILGMKAESVIGKEIFDIIPDTQLNKVMETGIAEFDVIKTVNNKQIIVNRIPIKVDDKVQGLLATFQDTSSIQESERKIRKKLTSKGLVSRYTFEDIITDNNEMKRRIEIAKGFARASSTILINGETGTGKELFAQSIHNYSSRSAGPFVAVNCAALPAGLLESELFGYEGGTFTGARSGGKIGLFELSHEGTIFLDEIAEIPMPLQAQLLRVLQEKQIRRLGSDKIIPIDVRIIAATNKNLSEEVKNGNFRKDLFYRVNVLRLFIPPLRYRREDIKEIGLKIIQNIDNQLYVDQFNYWVKILDALNNYKFYGNVRELHNVLERMLVIVKEGIYPIEKYNKVLDDVLNSEEYDTLNVELYAKEREEIINCLNRCNWSKMKAATELGISRSTLWRKMREYNIDS